jgi:hypothetical protein
LAVLTLENMVKVYEPASGWTPVFDIRMPNEIEKLLYTDSGRMLVCVGKDHQITLIDANGETHSLCWPEKLPKPVEIVASSEAPVMAGRSEENTVMVMRLSANTLSEICMIRSEKPIYQMAIDPRGEKIYAWTEAPFLTAVSWKVNDPGKGPEAVTGIQYDNQGPIVFPEMGVTVVADYMDLLLINEENPGVSIRLGGHDESVKLISGMKGLTASVSSSLQNNSADPIVLWTNDGIKLGPISMPEHLTDMTFSPDGNAMILLGNSGALYQVTLRTEDWISISRRIAGRELTKEEQRRFGVDVWRARSLDLKAG